MLAQLLAFLGVSVVVICVPGPDTALTVRNTLAGGRRCGAATAAGVAIGQTVWTLATGVVSWPAACWSGSGPAWRCSSADRGIVRTRGRCRAGW